jgi:radical SAM superfamily enzyme YgiQ (UPF0313 family)
LRDTRKKVAVVCATFNNDRSAKPDRLWLQPQTGLQIASQIDRDRYDVTLRHEMWHGLYRVQDVPEVDLVFLTGLQRDFDRQRQLAYLFKRRGAVTVAGGSVCTLFPDFAAGFFDAVCSGGVDSVPQVMRDFEHGELRRIYRSAPTSISDYRVDYRLLAAAGIGGHLHLVEASRGCDFACAFCTVPAERARFTRFGADRVRAMIDDAIDSSPWWSLKRFYPIVSFIDNNFANDRAYTLELCTILKGHSRLKGWGALVTQDVLRDHELIERMAGAGCGILFTGIESLDPKFLKANNKRQNVKYADTLFEDVAFAQKRGIVVAYGYLLDPRVSTSADMAAQAKQIARVEALTYPSYFSFIAPLLGTRLFWDSAERGEMRPNLRLRDLDGTTIAYRGAHDTDEELSRFAETVFRHTNRLVSRRSLVLKSLRMGWRGRRTHLRDYLVLLNANLRVMHEMRAASRRVRRDYLGGTDVLDPSYTWFPEDISAEDRRRYFDPILVTDDRSRLQPWLEPYRPAARRALSGITMVDDTP